MKRGILFAVAGTTWPGADVAFRNVEARARARFPGAAIRWVYTSGVVRGKLARKGMATDSTESALRALHAEGCTDVAVQPLHLVAGAEYNELVEAVRAFAHGSAAFDRLVLGKPLGETPDDIRRAADVLIGEIGKAGESFDALILVAHGSRFPGAKGIFETAERACSGLEKLVFVGTLMGGRGIATVLGKCREYGVGKACLVPFTVVAGKSARNEIAGNGRDSWATLLEEDGIQCVPFLKGLGEIDGIADIWLDRVESALAANENDGKEPIEETGRKKRQARPVLPVSLLVEGRPCLVVGGGSIAARKAGHLLAAGAAVTIVAPRVCEAIAGMAQAGRARIVSREFVDDDVAGCCLVFAATDSGEVNRRVLECARRRGILGGAIDANWRDGDFVTPAILRKGDLTVSVSTGGSSCRRARRVKEEIGELIDRLGDPGTREDDV